MNTSISWFEKLWLRFSGRFFQYSIQGIKKPNWLLMFVFGRIHIVRYFVLLMSKRPFTQNYITSYSYFEEIDVNKVIKILKKDGVYLGINLPKNLLQEIIDFSRHTIYIGNGDPKFCFSLADKEKEQIKWGEKFLTGYNLNSSLLCPAIKKLENDPKLWEIAAKYLETNPVIIGSQIWWTFGIKQAVDERTKGIFRFHYDVEDYRYIKFMFYLTDVDLTSGYHVCVKGSHRKKKLRYQFSLFRDIDDKKIIDYYGSENVINICGSAGFGFAEDPFCFHKGNLPYRKNRLILEVKFARKNYEFEPKLKYGL